MPLFLIVSRYNTVAYTHTPINILLSVGRLIGSRGQQWVSMFTFMVPFLNLNAKRAEKISTSLDSNI